MFDLLLILFNKAYKLPSLYSAERRRDISILVF
jgi:hypothetical protein